MTGVHVLLFDFDYTLADSSKGVIDCINYALVALGRPPANPDVVRKMIGSSLEETFAAVMNNTSPAEVRKGRELFLERADTGAMIEETQILGGVSNTLELLYDNMYTMGIVSTKRRSTIDQILNIRGLEEFFDVVIGFEDVKRVKPDPEALFTGMHRLGSSPDETVYVGDHVYDVVAARAAGLRVIAVNTGPTTRSQLENAGPDMLISEFSELQKVFNLV